jgi:hypothetical protein
MPDADDHAQAETDRKRALFDWARQLLEEIGIAALIAAASLQDLANIKFDADAAEIAIAIADALHPAGDREPAEHFKGLREGALKQILKGRFDELKRDRERELQSRSGAQARAQTSAQPDFNPADEVYRVLAKYVEVTPHQAIAITLWILHTHVYERFTVSPRLLLTSPVRGCGKSTLLRIAEQLTARAFRTDSITAAAIVRLVAKDHVTLLSDEADNLPAAANEMLRAILNGGHLHGANRVQVGPQGLVQIFPIFGAMAFAAIGMMPLPLMHRSVVIEMVRATGELERFDADDLMAMMELNSVFSGIARWARDTTFAGNPTLPKILRNRPADNWRVLIAIGDACGKEWGKFAREAALALTKDRPDEDPGVRLLTDIRDIFNQLKVDRIASSALIETLIAIEDGVWSEWRGLRDDQQPRRLTQGELARVLSPFRIKSRTVWKLGSRNVRGKSSRGYFKEQFTEAWRAYCPSDTPTHKSKINILGNTQNDTRSDTQDDTRDTP